jgi:hypothetical protein
VEIVTVEAVEVDLGSGAFARGTVGNRAKPADFVKRCRDLAGRRTVDGEAASVDELCIGR